MKIKPLTFFTNNSGLIEHIRVDLRAKTKRDKKDLSRLYRTGVVATSVNRAGEVLSVVFYIPVKKDVVFP